MVLTYVNSRGQTYYLHRGRTKKGDEKYYFSMKKDGELVQALPVDYEIHENPNARVFARKSRPKLFSHKEIEFVRKAVGQYTDLEHYKVDVKGNTISICLPNQDVDGMMDLLSELPLASRRDAARRVLAQSLTFSPEMRLILTDEKDRLFSLERYCYKGKGDWLTLESGRDLDSLAKKYFKHLGKDSFSDLFPWELDLSDP